MNKLVKNYGGGVRKKGNVYYYFFEGKSLNDKKEIELKNQQEQVINLKPLNY